MEQGKDSDDITNTTPLVLRKSNPDPDTKNEQQSSEEKTCLKQPCSKISIISGLLVILLIGICVGIGIHFSNQESIETKDLSERVEE